MKATILKCLVLLVSVWCFTFLNAQDIKPGTTATALSEYKASSSVDYSTGILNYNIPLLNIEQDGFTLPINLNYTARGIKVDDQPGLVGLGWSLNNGACIITRTLRGSAADESEQGILSNPIPEEYYQRTDFFNKVSANKADGESDIFTLNLLGKVVKFILMKQGDSCIICPLQQTDIKIKLLNNSYKEHIITGWQVTDEAGNGYEFEASKPSGVLIRTPVPTNSFASKEISSWYLKKIKVLNNDEIKFIYNDDYANIINNISSFYTHYETPFRWPKIHNSSFTSSILREAMIADEELIKTFGELRDVLYNIDLEIQNKQNSISNYIDLVTDWDYKHTEDEYDSKTKDYLDSLKSKMFLDEMNLETSKDAYKWASTLSYNYTQEADNKANYFRNAINDLFTTYEVPYEIQTYPIHNVFANRLIKQIVLRNAIIDFTYLERLNFSSNNSVQHFYDRIDYKTLDGNIIKSILFKISSTGFLNKVQVVNAKNEVEQEYNYDYYNETDYLNKFAQDYWGYYNGQTGNCSLFPDDPFYLVDCPQSCPPYMPSISIFGNESIFYEYRGGGCYSTEVTNKANRRPDGCQSISRSLKSVSTNTGKKIQLEYEGNEAIVPGYPLDNVQIGGIRIKSISESDNINTSMTTTYKYKFPLLSNPSILQSTGVLGEWKKKSFIGGSYDFHVFTDPYYEGTIYDDNSNNGVFYHYVEVEYPDKTSKGYKYLAPDFSFGYYREWHNPTLDKALLATIDYDTSGKIVKVSRNKYTYNINRLGNRYPDYDFLYFGGSGYEYFTDEEQRDITFSMEQVKKGVIYYNKEDLLKAFPDTNINAICLNSTPFYYNPRSFYTLNYDARCNYNANTESYNIEGGDALLLKEQEDIYVDNYNLPASYDSNYFQSYYNYCFDFSKAHLFNWLLGLDEINKIKNVTTYNYDNKLHLGPTIIKQSNSKGNVLLTKNKYVGDYQMPSNHPLLLLKNYNCNTIPIEKQLWISNDNGINYLLANSQITDYTIIQQNGNNFLLPTKKFVLQQNSLFSPASSYNFNESVQSSLPYNKLFWENQTLYKEEQSTEWKMYPSFIRPLNIKDRTGKILSSQVYDRFSGNLLLKATGVDGNNMAAIDLSPYGQHEEYNNPGFFQKHHITSEYMREIQNYNMNIFAHPHYCMFQNDYTVLDDMTYYLNSQHGDFWIDYLFNICSGDLDYSTNRMSEGDICFLNHVKIGGQLLHYLDSLLYHGNTNEISSLSILHSMRNLLNGIVYKGKYIENFKTAFNEFYLACKAMPKEEKKLLWHLEYKGIHIIYAYSYLNAFVNSNYWVNEDNTSICLDGIENILERKEALFINDSSRVFKMDISNLVNIGKKLSFYMNGITIPEYKFKYKDGSYSTIFSPIVQTVKGGISSGTIGFEGISNPTSIDSIEFYFSDECWHQTPSFYVLPEDAQFSAVSYLPDRKPFLMFDFTGKVNELGYDHFGRKSNLKNDEGEYLWADSLHVQSASTMQYIEVTVENNLPTNLQKPVTKIIFWLRDDRGFPFSIRKDAFILPGQFSKFHIPSGVDGIYVNCNNYNLFNLFINDQNASIFNYNTIKQKIIISVKNKIE